MARVVRVGNAQGFWGDRLEAAGEMLAAEPDLDYLTLDFLAEVSMSVLAAQRARDPQAGWPRDFLEVVRSIAPYWRAGGGCRIVTNVGGLDPLGCARACCEILREAGAVGRRVAAVTGDDVLELIRGGRADEDLLRNLDTGQPIADVRARLTTANAYIGAGPIAEALAAGADLVITGRVADPSLTVGPCAYEFGWAWDDWDRVAGATVAGHLIECGTQLTGGIATDWLQTPHVSRLGFPIAEVADDGSCVVTKPCGSGGRVSAATVKEQLLYETGDPDRYISPDAVVSILGLEVEDLRGDRVAIRGARGRQTTSSYKVSATYQDGYWSQGTLTVFGDQAAEKACRAGQSVLERLAGEGIVFRDAVVECLGGGACRPQGPDPVAMQNLQEAVLRVAVSDERRPAVERWTRELMPLVTGGPPGTTGYGEGRPRVHPLFRYWPCLIARELVRPHVTLMSIGEAALSPSRSGEPPHPAAARPPSPARGEGNEMPAPPSLAQPRRLADIAHARSGDKGIDANVGVIARRPEDYLRLCRQLTAARVAAYFGLADVGRVARYEVPNLGALNFVLHGILANPLRSDAQGKTLGQVLLAMPLEDV